MQSGCARVLGRRRRLRLRFVRFERTRTMPLLPRQRFRSTQSILVLRRRLSSEQLAPLWALAALQLGYPACGPPGLRFCVRRCIAPRGPPRAKKRALRFARGTRPAARTDAMLVWEVLANGQAPTSEINVHVVCSAAAHVPINIA